MTSPGRAPEPPEADRYPVDVRSPEERHRWDLALGIARELLATEGRPLLEMPARSIYDSDVPT